MLQGRLFSNWDDFLSGTTKNSQLMRFHCPFLCAEDTLHCLTGKFC
jgi:hypothetical protein